MQWQLLAEAEHTWAQLAAAHYRAQFQPTTAAHRAQLARCVQRAYRRTCRRHFAIYR